MPDRDWPPLHRRLARFLGALAYGCVATSGTGVLVDPPEWTSRAALVTVTALSLLALASGVLAALAVTLHNWHAEFVAVWFLAAATAGFAVIVWAGGSSFAGAALLTSIPLFCLLRGVQLWVFSLDARFARRQRISLWRRTASTEFHR